MSELPQDNPESTEPAVGEVRFSLKKLMQEVDEERRLSSSAKQFVDQTEISSIFLQKRRKRRGKR